MRTLLKSLLWLVGILAVLLLILQAILSPKVVKTAVEKLAAEYVEGTLSFERTEVSLFKRFPALNVRLHNMTLTYPSGRFASLEEAASEQRLISEGRNLEAGVDTLASFDLLEANLSLPSLLSGEIKIPRIKLGKARIFAKSYDDSIANWNIIRFDRFSSDQKDSTSGMPKIRLERASFSEHPHVVFCMPQDSLYSMVDFKDLFLKGAVRFDSLQNSSARVNIDSLIFLGRMSQDTLFFAIDRLETFAKNRQLFVSSDARALTATKSFGRLSIPVTLESKFNFPLDSVTRVQIERFNLDVAQIPLSAQGELSFAKDKTHTDVNLEIAQSNLDYLVQHFAELFWADASKVKISSSLSAHASCKGDFIPAEGKKPVLEINLQKLKLEGSGLHVDASCKTSDLFAKNPLFNLSSSFSLDAAKFAPVIPDTLGIRATGLVKAALKGNIRKKQLSLDNFAKADLNGSIDSDGLELKMLKDGIQLHLDNLHAILAATGNRFIDDDNKKARLLVLSMSLDSIFASLGDKFVANGEKLDVRAYNAPENIKHRKDGVFPFGGRVKAEHLFVMDSDSCMVELQGTANSFLFAPQKNDPTLPFVDLSSISEWLYVRYKANRMIASELSLSGRALMKPMRRFRNPAHVADSVSMAKRDSIPLLLQRMEGLREALAQKKDTVFENANLSFNLNETMSKYYDNWSFSGKLSADSLGVGSPYYPLKTTASTLSGSFNNDKIELDNINICSGRSDLQAKGSISGLRRFLRGYGILGLDMSVGSKVINIKEIMDAYRAGQAYGSQELRKISEMSDEEYIEEVANDSIVEDNHEDFGFRLILPSNVDANVKLEAGEISFGDYLANSFDAEMAMKQRTLQVTNTVMITPVGNLYLEGFYATRNRQDIKAGLNLSLEDVTVEKVIDLVPQMDTLVPILSSLSGLLDCEIALTSDFDSNFKLDYPSMTGVIRLMGENLSIYDNEQLAKLSRLLMFRDQGGAFVDSLRVEGQLKKEQLELYPFYFNVDRYGIAMSGIQDMNTSFKYHISVIKSPLPVKFGLDLWGNFSDSSFKLGKAKYRDVGSVPDFSSVIDDSRARLSSSIRSIHQLGADKAVAENSAQNAIQDFKKRLNYVSAVDMKMDALSKKEQDEIDSADDGNKKLE